jgi:MFS family permease
VAVRIAETVRPPVAREAVGPALAGVLLAQVGPAVVFAITAVSALAFVVVLLRTRRPAVPRNLPPERFASAVRAGGRYVRNSPAVRRMLLRVFLFVLPGAAVWALLPLVADDLLDAGSTGFGLLLGSLGAGAVLGAAVLPRLTARLAVNRMLVLSAVLFAVSLVACVTVPTPQGSNNLCALQSRCNEATYMVARPASARAIVA